ncbi:hypothetical protein [Natronoglycomyces albus]|uniref:Uncharacterized protein n=1 Tax=Natronoglycomyces albus TaxID=2811108 RepID=A0A895XMB7_9ACTN|nr:hypothetical protein [Natronoglycomyces albus]QSB06811.1 hypothetical protein JQS30_07965 [Natronoglycomyces albus]
MSATPDATSKDRSSRRWGWTLAAIIALALAGFVFYEYHQFNQLTLHEVAQNECLMERAWQRLDAQTESVEDTFLFRDYLACKYTP